MRLKQFFIFTLISAILLTSASVFAKPTNAAHMVNNPKITSILRVSDGKLMSGGSEVVLNGVNLGGWLIQETWMSPVADENEEMAYSDVLDVLTRRFGEVAAAKLIQTYEDSFITEADFKRIASLGFNCVRIPFWYRNFMTEDGTWLTESPAENPGFKRLDWALRLCKKYNLYAILDMHGCPGGQSKNHSTGKAGENTLYLNKKNLDTMEKLWCEIVRRYKDNVNIAAYDIMNEPQNNKGYSGLYAWQAESAQAAALTNAVYKRMTAAIRKIDTRHIITVEGIWTINVLPDPAEYGWENMMYQLHIYDNTRKMIDLRIKELTDARERFGVAVYAGEYNSGKLERYASDLYEKHGISRTRWTYKTVGADTSGWGIYRRNYNKIDIETASLEKIKQAFGADMRTENDFEIDDNVYKAIMDVE